LPLNQSADIIRWFCSVFLSKKDVFSAGLWFVKEIFLYVLFDGKESKNLAI
jgi:hypothetical protein